MTPLVSVIVITYNQEATIGQTLEHIVAQERDFDIEVIVGDDASADGTRAVCEDYVARYPFIRLMPSAPNKGVLRNYLDCLFECKGEYIAGCAGDDFWHGHLKLKKQVAFLDANPDYGVVHGATVRLNMETGVAAEEEPRTPPDGWLGKDIYLDHIVEAPTACFRRSLVQYIEREEWLRRGFAMEDLPMWILFAHYSKFRFMPEYMVTYRIWPVSECRGGSLEKQIRFIESVRDVRYYFWDKYRPPFPRRLITNKYRRRILRLVWGSGDRRLFWQKARDFGVVYSLAIALGEKIKGR